MVAGGDHPSPTEAAAETLSPFEEMVLRRKRSKEWRKAYHPQSGKILSFKGNSPSHGAAMTAPSERGPSLREMPPQAAEGVQIS